MHVWLAKDPKTGRIVMQAREFGEGNFPPGDQFRGAIWPILEGEIPEDVWAQMMSGQLPADEQDRIHRELWMAADES